ncbi:hypothetical protein HW555_003594 [Spodoptera exigua]|uniref:Uncharacterized protein n=1 Tax=Spodoptera exigua TaxID=7107 RepID=A0A835GJR6_SPOEX|nr:hypothetical protein HW555_003594 [Spodoptera exigua]
MEVMLCRDVAIIHLLYNNKQTAHSTIVREGYGKGRSYFRPTECRSLAFPFSKERRRLCKIYIPLDVNFTDAHVGKDQNKSKKNILSRFSNGIFVLPRIVECLRVQS